MDTTVLTIEQSESRSLFYLVLFLKCIPRHGPSPRTLARTPTDELFTQARRTKH